MAFTQCQVADVRRNPSDASVTVTVVYTGQGEEDTKQAITFPAGSVLDARTLQAEAIRRIATQNDAVTFEQTVKLLLNTTIDLTPPDDPADVVTLRSFAVLAGRMRDLERSQQRGCASQDAYLAALAAMQQAYADVKDDAVRAKMDSVVP